jgi:hypothetical protein
MCGAKDIDPFGAIAQIHAGTHYLYSEQRKLNQSILFSTIFEGNGSHIISDIFDPTGTFRVRH